MYKPRKPPKIIYNSKLFSIFADLQTTVDQLSANEPNTAIGFHAIRSIYEYDIPKDSPIKYDDVKLNKGNRYSSSTGIFTADRSGLYYFEQYWVTDGDIQWKGQNLYINKNGASVCRSWGNSHGNNQHNSQSCSAVVELKSGDEVYVTSGQGYNTIWSSATGFTGFLIKSYV